MLLLLLLLLMLLPIMFVCLKLYRLGVCSVLLPVVVGGGGGDVANDRYRVPGILFVSDALAVFCCSTSPKKYNLPTVVGKKTER